jgi:hypothetical protein
LAAAFLAPPFFAAFFAGFFAVAIVDASPFLESINTQDAVALLLLCTSLNDTQHIVVYIYFTNPCQRFFSQPFVTIGTIEDRTAKLATRATFAPVNAALARLDG